MSPQLRTYLMRRQALSPRHLKISFQVFLRQIFSAKFFKFSYLWLLLLHIVYSISAIAHWLAQTWLAQTWF